MYDFLDDVLDSYYIFLCDFDDDEYFSETTFSVFGLLFFEADNHDDRSIFFEDEADLRADLFSLYFIIWSKFALFFFFALDEIARVFLAFYLVYLMIFEIQSVNRSYGEDLYVVGQRKPLI
jgi:succinate-acetate transporter protein